MKWTNAIRSGLKIPMSTIEYFGIEAIIGGGLCWAVFLLILLIDILL
ncbi:MAG: hypothetical protein HN584_08945 [Akkermansiaceae bacterium]|nr:hypothetical protein [Akkermansiaceae bacterium]